MRSLKIGRSRSSRNQWLPARYLPRIARPVLAVVPPLLMVAAIVNTLTTPVDG